MGRRRVVVVDDDIQYLHAIRRAAMRFRRQFELEIYPSGDSALSHAGERPTDLAIVDVIMPGTDGFETCRRLKLAARDVTIVLVTANLTTEVVRAALDAGAARALEKPVDLAALVGELTPSDVAAELDRARMIEQHLDLARNIARGLARRYGNLLSPDDIDALARLGLVEAAARYDEDRSEPFVAFAESRIRGAVIDELRRQGSQSRSSHERRRKILELRAELVERGDDSSDEHIADKLGITPAAVKRSTEPRRYVGAEHLDELPSDDPTPELRVERAELGALLADARDALSPTEAAVIRMRYDLEMGVPAIAKALGLPANRVVQLQRRGIEALRRTFAWRGKK